MQAFIEDVPKLLKLVGRSCASPVMNTDRMIRCIRKIEGWQSHLLSLLRNKCQGRKGDLVSATVGCVGGESVSSIIEFLNPGHHLICSWSFSSNSKNVSENSC